MRWARLQAVLGSNLGAIPRVPSASGTVKGRPIGELNAMRSRSLHPQIFLASVVSNQLFMRSAYGEYFQRRGMMAQQSGSAMTGKPLIESDRVEGTTVYDPSGDNIGSIKRLMIEKISGGVAYAVMSFGGFLGMGTEEHAVPNKLTYDTNLGGYRTDITEQQLRGAPAFSRDRSYDWSDRNRERELHDYYGVPPYWGA